MAKKKAKKRKKKKPSSNGTHGRNKRGQFDKGNKIGVGNKGNTNEKARELKKELLEAITKEDIKSIGEKLVEKAKNGDVPATKELFDRLWGKAKQEVELNASEDLNSFIEWLAGRDDT